MAACAAICEAVRLAMAVLCSDEEAVGRVGSKKPCEYRGRCFCRSGGGARGEEDLRGGGSFCGM